jgi:hypothetical protein
MCQSIKIAGVIVSFIVALAGCNRPAETHSKNARISQGTAQTAAEDSEEQKYCVGVQTSSDGCGGYEVLSYDATWTNEFGNEGRFVLQRDGLKILAHCGSVNCWRWIDAVGKRLEADKSITDLITYHLPDCKDPDYVKTARELYKMNTRQDASFATVCSQTLVVEKIEAIRQSVP